MAKKHFILAALATCGLLMTSCQQEEMVAPEGDGLTTFTVNLPAQSFTRADGDTEFSDGTKATKLEYAVYETDTEEVLYTSKTNTDPQAIHNTDDGQYFELKLKLIKGKTYDIIFWAQSPDVTCYTFDPEHKTVTVNYDGVAVNDDTRDAFFRSIKYTVKEGGNTEAIYLYRPFGQINIGINDLDEAKRAMNVPTDGTLQTKVTVKGVHNVLNLQSGVTSAEGDAQNVTFALGTPATNQTFPVAAPEGEKDYTYMAMGYVLTGEASYYADKGIEYQAQKEAKDVEIAFSTDGQNICRTIPLSAVPFQRNHRTNIFGSLLTTDVHIYLDKYLDFLPSDFNNIYSVSTLDELQTAIDCGGTQISLKNDMELGENEQIIIRNNSKLQRINLDGHTLTFKGNPNDKEVFPGITYENVSIDGVAQNVCYLMGGTGKDNKRGKIVNERTKRAIDALDSRLYLYKLDIESNEQTGGNVAEKDYWDNVIACFGGILYMNDVTVTTNGTTVVYMATDGSSNATISNCTFTMTGAHGYVFLWQYDGNNYQTATAPGTISFTNCKMSTYASAITTNLSGATYHPTVSIKDCVFGRFGSYERNPILDLNSGIGNVNISGSVFYSESTTPVSRIISDNAPVIENSLFSAVPVKNNNNVAIEGAADVTETLTILNPAGQEVSVTLTKKF